MLTSAVVKRSEALQAQIWQIATDPNHALRGESVEQVLLPTLTGMFAVAKSSNSAGLRHPPRSSTSCCSVSPRQRAACRLRHGGEQAAELAAHDRLRPEPGRDRVHDLRHRVPPLRPHSRRSVRPSSGQHLGGLPDLRRRSQQGCTAWWTLIHLAQATQPRKEGGRCDDRVLKSGAFRVRKGFMKSMPKMRSRPSRCFCGGAVSPKA